MKIVEFFNSYKAHQVRKPYLIAEAGVNHEGSMDLAKRLIEEAQEGGADAIKFQTYKAETLASKDSPYYWDITKEATRSQFELFKKYDSFWKKEYEVLKNICDRSGIEFLSTAFDLESAGFLNDLMPVFKISSSDITNFPFIEYQCGFGKPVILSIGASELWEVQEAVSIIEKKGNVHALLQCVLNYPTENKNANLSVIREIIRNFPNAVPGYSDHTLPEEMDTLIFAAISGAAVLEKHFTFDKKLPGNDHYHAMDREDIRKYLRKWAKAEELLGNNKIMARKSEEPARKNARRSLVAAKSIPAGKVIERTDLTWKRPASGISAKYFDAVVGKIARTGIAEDTVLVWNMFS